MGSSHERSLMSKNLKGDTLFAISDLMKKQKEELEEEMDEIIGEKFEKLNEKMNDKSIRPLKIEVKVETNDVRKDLYSQHLQGEVESARKLAQELKKNMEEKVETKKLEKELEAKVGDLVVINDMKDSIKRNLDAQLEIQRKTRQTLQELKESSQVKPDEKHFEATDEQLKEWSNNMETYLDMQKERMKKRRCTIT